MATENLEINIGANTQDLQTGLNAASQSVQSFGNAVKTNLKPTADATNALTNLSRVAQDAPYGFMGIANNLNPLLESFQRLSKESGGAGSALKALVGGLTGPAGIGLALGAISSLVVAFGDDIANWVASTNELEKANKQLRASFIDNLKSAEATIASDEALVSVITDVTQSTEAREAALTKLKSEYKGNVELQKTDINDGSKLVEIITKISNALVRKAEIEATSKIIGEKYAELIRLQTADLEEQIGDLSIWAKGWDILGGSIRGVFGGTAGQVTAQSINLTTDALDKNAKQATKTQNSINSLKETLKGLTQASFEAGDYATLSTSAPRAGGGSANSTTNNVDTSKLETLKKLAQLYKDEPYLYKENADKIALETQRINKLKVKEGKDAANQIIEIDNQYAIDKLQNEKDLGDKLTKLFAAQDKEWLRGQKEANKKKEEAEDEADKKRIEAEKKKAKQLEELQKEQENFAKFISSEVTGALFSMYDAMQQGESPLQALGDYFTNLAEQIAAAAIQAAIFQAILMAVGGGGGASFGEGFTGIFKGLLGMAEGGIVTRPTIAMVGEGGQSEAVMPLNKLGNMMNSTFNAGAMSGTGAGNGQFVLKGQDLILAINRSNASLNLRRGF
jgi:hypothetical protein